MSTDNHLYIETGTQHGRQHSFGRYKGLRLMFRVSKRCHIKASYFLLYSILVKHHQMGV